MTISTIQNFLLWSSIINIGLLLLSVCILRLAHDFVFRVHSLWLKITEEQFNMAMYSVIAFYKVCIIFFNVMPYILLQIVL